MDALLYSAFTHHYKSQLKKQSCLEKGGERTGLEKNKRKLNDVVHKSKTVGGQPRGQTGQGNNFDIARARKSRKIQQKRDSKIQKDMDVDNLCGK